MAVCDLFCQNDKMLEDSRLSIMMQNRTAGKKEKMIQEVRYTGTSFVFSWHINCFFYILHLKLDFMPTGYLFKYVEGLLQNTPEREARPARREVIPFPSTF
jgi:hypothetical protein